MIPIRAEKILKKLRDEESGSLSIAELEKRTGIPYQTVQNLCDLLVDVGLIRRGEKREHTGDYVVITAKGRYRKLYDFNAVIAFLVKSVIVPIAITVITLWVEGVLSKIVESIRQLSL